ncbi:hypothetical protein Ahia01_001041500 [Argonauta hians]
MSPVLLLFFLVITSEVKAAPVSDSHELSISKRESTDAITTLTTTTTATTKKVAAKATSATTKVSATATSATTTTAALADDPNDLDTIFDATDPKLIQPADILSDEETIVNPSKWKRYTVYVAVASSVLLLAITVYGLWRNTLCCVSVICCPCSIAMLPCLHAWLKTFDPVVQLKKYPDKYIPGIFVDNDGNCIQYSPTPEEFRCLNDLIRRIENE